MTSKTGNLEPRLDARALRLRRAVCAIALLVVVSSFAYAPWANDGPVVCPLRLATGIPCPSCGLTRSFCAMSRGALGAAFGFHLFGPFLYACTLLAIPWTLVESLRGKRFTFSIPLPRSMHVAWMLAVLLVVYHVTRLAAAFADGTLQVAFHQSALGGACKTLFATANAGS